MRLVDIDNISESEIFSLIVTALKESKTVSWLSDVIIDLLNEQPEVEVPQWIPCSERLPVKMDNQIVCTRDGGLTIACLTYEDIWIDMYENEVSDVVAWMWLPNAYYKEDE